MLVVVAGLKRSGSTWMFNVARIAMDRAGLEPQIGEYDLWRSERKGNLLIKSHWWHANLAEAADVVLTSERDVEKVHASLERFWGCPPSGREMAKIVEHHRRWDAVSGYRMRYGDLVADPLREVRGILGALGLTLEAAGILAEVEAIKPPAEGQDPKTLLFHNHRASP